MIDCRATDEFIDTQFVYTYNLPTVPLIKAYALQLINSSFTV
jgi:hypothetical protein